MHRAGALSARAGLRANEGLVFRAEAGQGESHPSAVLEQDDVVALRGGRLSEQRREHGEGGERSHRVPRVGTSGPCEGAWCAARTEWRGGGHHSRESEGVIRKVARGGGNADARGLGHEDGPGPVASYHGPGHHEGQKSRRPPLGAASSRQQARSRRH